MTEAKNTTEPEARPISLADAIGIVAKKARLLEAEYADGMYVDSSAGQNMRRVEDFLRTLSDPSDDVLERMARARDESMVKGMEWHWREIDRWRKTGSCDLFNSEAFLAERIAGERAALSELLTDNL